MTYTRKKEINMKSTMPETIDDLRTCQHWGHLFDDEQLSIERVAKELMDFASVWSTLGAVIDEHADGMTGCYQMYTAEAINEQLEEKVLRRIKESKKEVNNE